VVYYGIEVTFNDMTSVLNFMKIYQLVQKLLVGETNGRTGDVINRSVYAGLIWLRIGTGCSSVVNAVRTLGFHKSRGISCLTSLATVNLS
jgi:nitric oxide reductase large subunit